MRSKALLKNLGYYFRDLTLLEQALRHRSVGKLRSNERLEFLGDAVLNFIIGAELFRRYPEMKEGELSRLRANLVNGELLAELAMELNVGAYLQFGSSEGHNGGARRHSILADAMEAIIGAIYLDGGIIITERIALTWFATRLDATAGVVQKDPKTLLQEQLQMQRLPLPAYKVVATTGAAHSQVFTVTCKVSGIEEPTTGVGLNKRRAEREAAEKMLHKIATEKLLP